MPQFDPHFFATQLFWLFVTFVLLYVLLSRLSMPKIGAVLEERQRRIDDNLEKAAKLKAEAEAAIAAYEKALAESRAKAHDILKANADEISRQAESRARSLGERLASEIKAGEARINEAKGKALAEIEGLAVEVAQAAVRKLTGLESDAAQAAAAVAAAIGGKR